MKLEDYIFKMSFIEWIRFLTENPTYGKDEQKHRAYFEERRNAKNSSDVFNAMKKYYMQIGSIAKSKNSVSKRYGK